MRFWRRWRIIRFSALAFAVAAFVAPAALAMPVMGDGPGYSGEVVTPAPKLITDAHFRTGITTSSASGFDWTYLEVGLGGALGLIVLAGGAAAVVKRNRELLPAGA
jgi:hypothetical protein